MTRFGALARKVDERQAGIALPLLSVSQTRGVLRQSDLSDRPPRADSLDTYKICRRGDIVFNKMSIRAGAMGVAAEDGLVTYHYEVMRPLSGSDARFISYLMKSSAFTVELIKSERGIGAGSDASGVRTTEVPFSVMKKIDVWVPPLSEQRQIAEYLDQETSKIDKLITKQEQLVTTLDERRLAVISRAVTRGLRQDEVMRPSGIDWLGDVPTAWTVKRIKDSVCLAKNGVWGDEPDGGVDDIWCVRVADFDRSALSVSQLDKTIRNVRKSERNGRMLKRGDLILEKSGGGEKSPVGFVAIYDYDEPAVCSNFVARIKLKPGQNARYWLYLHAAAYGTRLSQRSIKQTSGIQNLDQSSYFNEKVAFPPLDEQVSIVEYLDEVLTQINTVVSKTRRSVALLRERRAALISAAVTGKINVRSL